MTVSKLLKVGSIFRVKQKSSDEDTTQERGKKKGTTSLTDKTKRRSEHLGILNSTEQFNERL